MKPTQDRILWLLERYSKRTATEAELTELTDWMAVGEDQLPFDTFVTQLLDQHANQQQGQDPSWEIIYEKIRAGRPLLAEPSTPAPVRSLPKRWMVAASIIMLLGIGAWIWNLQSKKDPTGTVTVGTSPIGPGKQGAILTLANGEQIVLDSLGNGVVASENGVQVKLGGGELSYEANAGAGTVSYNAMSTPKGRQFRLQLPDGTKVWLNAASSIRYPVAFSGKDRRVEITGEGYFEVAHDKTKPFLVKINNKSEVEVLGTRFNINAYRDEENIRTTLLEGSIRLSKSGTANPSTAPVLLKPGQQAQLSNDELSVVNKPDLDKVMAWKNGQFNFEGVRLREMMRQLERWYDIEVIYEGNVPDVPFFGKMSRQLDLSTVLSALKGFGLHFRIEENRKIIITP